jgi:hypothetical protein
LNASNHDADYPGDFSDPRVVDLLRIHLNSARTETAPGSAHALDLTGLQSRGLTAFVRCNILRLFIIGFRPSEFVIRKLRGETTTVTKSFAS